jgi:4-hydroxy-3-methylbut-2-enyl diphosphate reductase
LLVQEVIARLNALGAASVRELSGVVEKVAFPMPRGLGGEPRGTAPATLSVRRGE